MKRCRSFGSQTSKKTKKTPKPKKPKGSKIPKIHQVPQAPEPKETSTGPEIVEPSTSPEIPEPSTSPEIPEPSTHPEIVEPSTHPEIPEPSTSPEIPEPSTSPEIPEPSTHPEIPEPSTSPEIPEPSTHPEIPEPSTIPESSESAGLLQPLTSVPLIFRSWNLPNNDQTKDGWWIEVAGPETDHRYFNQTMLQNFLELWYTVLKTPETPTYVRDFDRDGIQFPQQLIKHGFRLQVFQEKMDKRESGIPRNRRRHEPPPSPSQKVEVFRLIHSATDVVFHLGTVYQDTMGLFGYRRPSEVGVATFITQLDDLNDLVESLGSTPLKRLSVGSWSRVLEIKSTLPPGGVPVQMEPALRQLEEVPWPLPLVGMSERLRKAFP